MAQYNKKYLRRYMPKELTESTGTAKLFPISPKCKISHKQAVEKAEIEYDKYRIKQDRNYISSMDEMYKRYLEGE